MSDILGPFADSVDETMDIEAIEARRIEAAKQRAQYENQLDADYTWLMQSHHGRRMFWDLLAPMWRSSYTGSREDTDFREGERNVALRVWARLTRACPALAHKMFEEYNR